MLLITLSLIGKPDETLKGKQDQHRSQNKSLWQESIIIEFCILSMKALQK